MYDIVIIGAGVVGGMIAEMLSKYNVRACILEKAEDVAMGATKANSAIVHGGFDPVVGSLKARMNKRGSELMPKVCARLGVKYNNNQALVVGFENERAEVEDDLKYLAEAEARFGECVAAKKKPNLILPMI